LQSGREAAQRPDVALNPPGFVEQRPLLERFFTPEWAGGWLFTRYLWVFAAILEHAWRVTAIRDAYCAPDMVFASGVFRLTEYVVFSPTHGYLLWSGSMLGIAMVAWGGRAFRPGLLLWAVCAWTLMGYEALNVKAHDRLLTWIAIGLLFSPAGERGLTRKYRSPAPRMYLIIAYIALYGSTGLDKHLHEASWWSDGQVLGYHLLNFHHGSGPLAVWVSNQQWIYWPAGMFSVVFEVAFPFVIWFRRLNPVVLAMGFMFHAGLLALMQVGPFAFVAVSAYPVLLHPELGRKWYFQLERRFSRGGRATLGPLSSP
jgi:hypothetical protein